MFKKLFLIVCFIALLFKADAVSQVLSPLPKCVSVLSNGDVTLNWSVPSDPSSAFNSYLIYTSSALNGPYALLDSVFTYTQNSYTHIGANANLASVFYYILTRSNPGNTLSPALDTVRTMFLNVTNPGNGTAVLNWNSIATPAISTSSNVYTIYEEYPSGVWNVTGTTSNLFLIDSIFICNAAINFKVELADNTGCTSVSSIDGGVFQNTIVPAIPMLDTLSVDDNNNAIMNWNASPSADVKAYVIYKFTGGIWLGVDTVYGINNTSYNYLLSTADLASEQYRLTAFDSCGNVSPLGTSYQTIHLTASADICAHSATLNWSAYPQLGSGLNGYKIYMTTTGPAGPYILAGSVASTVRTYTVSGLTPNLNYYFKIQAFDASGTRSASSNRYKFYAASPVPPLFSYLRKVSVIDPDRVDITCHVDTAASTLKYKIMRSKDTVAANFVQIGTMPSSNSTPIVYSDHNVSTDDFSYYYKVINVDSCGFDGIVTNIGRTILVKATGHNNATNTITWNDYENWSGNVMSYNIYRGIDGVMETAPFDNVPFTGAGINSYTDYISGILDGQGVFNYRVEALEGMGNIYGFNDNSFSNIAEAYQEPLVYIPNAFKPAGFNSIFIPVTTYVNISEYEFDVFNRWGIKIFSTDNIEEGWDGTQPGGKSGLGVYVYLLRFKTSRGEYIERTGTVTLLR